MVTNVEITGKRDLTYSKFLRTCIPCTDLDFIIYNMFTDKVIAIIEAKEGYDNYPTEYQHKLCLHLEKVTGALYYLIQYKKDNEKIYEVRVTMGHSLKLRGARSRVVVEDYGTSFTQYQHQHRRWLKSLCR